MKVDQKMGEQRYLVRSHKTGTQEGRRE